MPQGYSSFLLLWETADFDLEHHSTPLLSPNTTVSGDDRYSETSYDPFKNHDLDLDSNHLIRKDICHSAYPGTGPSIIDDVCRAPYRYNPNTHDRIATAEIHYFLPLPHPNIDDSIERTAPDHV